MTKQRWTAFGLAVATILAAIFGIVHWSKAPRILGATAPGGATLVCPLGWYQPDPNTSQCSTAFGWQPSVSDASTPIFSVQGLTPGNSDFVAALISVQAPGATDSTGTAWFRYKWGFTYPADGSSFADPTGATTPTLVDSQIGSGLLGTTMNLVQTGSTLQVTMNCATATACASSGSVDWFRNAVSPWVTAVSPAMIYATAGSPTLLTITTTPGGWNGTTGGGCIVPGAYAGSATGSACGATTTPLTGCIQTSPTGGTCFLASGSYTAGVDSVCIQSAASPFCLVSGFTLDAAAPADAGVDAADAADAADSGTDSGTDSGNDSGGDAGEGGPDADPGYAAHYSGTPSGGSTWSGWADLTGNGHTCIPIASPTTGTINGVTVPTFNGTTQYCSTELDAGGTGAVCSAGAVTLLTVSRFNTAATRIVASLSGYNPVTDNASIGYLSTSHIFGSNSVTNIIETGSALTAGDIYCAALVSNGASPASFVNRGSTQTTGTMTTLSSAQPLTVGALIGSTGFATDPIDGPVAEVAVSCFAETESQVAAFCAAAVTNWGAVAFYRVIENDERYANYARRVERGTLELGPVDPYPTLNLRLLSE